MQLNVHDLIHISFSVKLTHSLLTSVSWEYLKVELNVLFVLNIFSYKAESSKISQFTLTLPMLPRYEGQTESYKSVRNFPMATNNLKSRRNL